MIKIFKYIKNWWHHARTCKDMGEIWVGYNHQIGTRQGDQMIIVEWDKLHYLNEMVAKLTKMEYTHENG